MNEKNTWEDNVFDMFDIGCMTLIYLYHSLI